MAGDFGPALPAGAAPQDLKEKEWEEHIMATKRPSFLKRQKEQKRNARALQKREARRDRKEARSSQPDVDESSNLFEEGTTQDGDEDEPQQQ
jgi:hypothetical protein